MVNLESRRAFYLPAGRLCASADAHDRAAGDAAGDVVGERRRQVLEGDGAGHDALEVPWPQVGCDALPHRQAPFAPRRRGVDAEQRYAAQDEGHHGGGERRTRGEADAGDVAPEVDRAREPREGLAAEVVDGAAEARVLEWPRAEIEIFAQQHLARSELLQVRYRSHLAADRDDPVAAHTQHVDGEA